MSKHYIEDKVFKGDVLIEREQLADEYDRCKFTNCIFSGADLSGIYFTDCIFKSCDFSMANLKNTASRNVMFKFCKILGLHFYNCNAFLLSFAFDECILNFSSFYKLKLKNTSFINCKLEELEFVETDLTNSLFANCDLAGTVFENTILEKADLRTSYNYSINPEINRIRKAKFAMNGVSGLLDAYDIIVE